MKEKLIQEISIAMTEILSVEQIAQLNGVLLQVVSKYTITQDEENCLPNKWKDALHLPLSIMVLPSGNSSKPCQRKSSIIPLRIFGLT